MDRDKQTPDLLDTINLPDSYPYPYTPEEFTDEEREVISRFFTNDDKPVFAIHGLPQEVVGAMFSRYSRTDKSVRRLFLDEFWGDPELGIQHVTHHIAVEEGVGVVQAQEKAANFFERVFVQFGDESVIQLGSAHIAFEFVSQIAAKAIEDQRIGAAYLEKSTRYLDFGSQENGRFLCMDAPEIMSSEHGEEYVNWNTAAFEAYNRHLPTTVEHLRAKYPIKEQIFETKAGAQVPYTEIPEAKDQARAQRAYERALNAKAFDTVRVFLPTTTVTNIGAHFSGQAAENTINKMLASPHAEVRLLGAMGFQELQKIIPSFLRKIDHPHGHQMREYRAQQKSAQERVVAALIVDIAEVPARSGVRLVDWDNDTDIKLATQLIYAGQAGTNRSLRAIRAWAMSVKEQELSKSPEVKWSPTLTEIITSAIADRSQPGLNRRHKLSRDFEHADAEVEFNIDFGVYRDLQRNRMCSTERLLLNADEVHIPPEFLEPGMEEILGDYLQTAEQTKDLHAKIMVSSTPRAAEYITLFGNKIKFSIRANIRQWVFMSELRTSAGGHPTYRRAMQRAVRQMLHIMPFLEPHFTHVDWQRDYGLGRLKAEVKTQRKLANLQ